MLSRHSYCLCNLLKCSKSATDRKKLLHHRQMLVMPWILSNQIITWLNLFISDVLEMRSKGWPEWAFGSKIWNVKEMSLLCLFFYDDVCHMLISDTTVSIVCWQNIWICMLTWWGNCNTCVVDLKVTTNRYFEASFLDVKSVALLMLFGWWTWWTHVFGTSVACCWKQDVSLLRMLKSLTSIQAVGLIYYLGKIYFVPFLSSDTLKHEQAIPYIILLF